MAELVVICSRDTGASLPKDALLRCASLLAPDNITPRAPLVLGRDGLAVLVVNPPPGLPATAAGACAGAMLAPHPGWDVPGSPWPDGTYALCRFDDARLELLTDPLGSRTIWYVRTDDVFAASTSQRALVFLLGAYEPSADAVSWMASSGSLGAAPWDRRLRRSPPATRLSLHRPSWAVASDTRPVRGDQTPRSDGEHVARLRDALLESCAALDIDLDSWLLPLSGGHDSRMILLGLLAAGRRPHCITWGLQRSAGDPASDTSVARRLAAELGVEHEFVATDAGDQPVRQVLTRFLVAGEGRTEQLAGYIDGLRLWGSLFQRGVAGVLRGDEPPWGSYSPIHSTTYARRRMHLKLIDDYPEGHLIRRLGLARQAKPPYYDPLPGESIPAYRDRVYEKHSVPFILGPLNDIKGKYVEVASPFLTAQVVRASRELPEHLRPGRRAFRRVVDEMGPNVPFAKHSAIAGAGRYLHSRAFAAELLEVLSSQTAARVCPRHGLDLVIERLERPAATSARRGLRQAVRATVPSAVRRRLQPDPPLSLGAPELAFRLYVAVRMDELLREDAALRDRPA
jgi:hypothetical protein